jgi:hypothetical protein
MWLVISPWALGFAHTRAMHYSIGIGAVVAFFALLELWLQYDTAHPGPTHQDSAAPSATSQRR